MFSFKRVAAAAAAIVLMAGTAHAQATRTWVSGVGNDANPCSRTAPCKTFAGAISKTAVGGLINAVDPGGFGAVTITKSITIDGGPFHAGILASGTNGVAISGASIEVTLRNLQIEGNNLSSPAAPGLNGVTVSNAGRVFIDNCVITQFSQKGVNMNTSSPAFLNVSNSWIEGNTGGGVFVAGGTRAEVSNTKLYRNQAAGIQVTNGIVTATDVVATGGSQGFVANTSSSAAINLNRCVSSHNDFGVVGAQSATVRVNNCQIFSNTTNGVFSDGTATMITFQNNTIDGNPANSAFTVLKLANQ